MNFDYIEHAFSACTLPQYTVRGVYYFCVAYNTPFPRDYSTPCFSIVYIRPRPLRASQKFILSRSLPYDVQTNTIYVLMASYGRRIANQAMTSVRSRSSYYVDLAH